MGDDPNYIEPIALGDAVRSSVIGRVVNSNSPDFAVGDVAMSLGAWEQYTTVPAAGLNRLDEASGIPLSLFLGALGPTGLTAYFGLLEVGRPKAGETVLVSAAAGAVGSVVGQIAKMQGCRVVGMAGSDDKCHWLTERAGLRCRHQLQDLRRLRRGHSPGLPGGCGCVFRQCGRRDPRRDPAVPEQICAGGGVRLDLHLQRPERTWPRPICGSWSPKSVTIQGFTVLDYLDRFGEGIGQLAQWLMAGKLQVPRGSGRWAGQCPADLPAAVRWLQPGQAGDSHSRVGIAGGATAAPCSCRRFPAVPRRSLLQVASRVQSAAWRSGTDCPTRSAPGLPGVGCCIARGRCAARGSPIGGL